MRWRNRERNPLPAAFLGPFIRLVSGILLLLPAATLSSAQDFQSWNEVDLTASYKGIDFLVPLLARIDSSFPNPQLAATGITADFRVPLA